MILGRRRRTSEDPREALRDLLGDYELPSFPAVIAEAVERITDPDAPLRDVADVVQQDPGLSVHLLRTVNSMAFAPRTAITTVHQAATMLGRNALESTLITFATKSAVDASSSSGFDRNGFWAAAAQRAAIAAELATHVDPARRSDNFTAALLQDMAIPVLVSVEESYAELLERWTREGGDLAALEDERFAWTHGSIAELMCAAWGFPESLIESVAGHHEPVDPQDVLVPAKLMSMVAQSATPAHDELVMRIAEVYQLDEQVAGEIVRTGVEQGREVAQILK